MKRLLVTKKHHFKDIPRSLITVASHHLYARYFWRSGRVLRIAVAACKLSALLVSYHVA